MRLGAFNTRGHRPATGQNFITFWHNYRANLSAQFAQGIKRIADDLADFKRHTITHIIPVNTYTHASKTHLRGFVGVFGNNVSQIIGHTCVHGAGIVFVVARHHTEHARRVFYTTGHRANMIKAASQRKRAIQTDPAISGLQSN